MSVRNALTGKALTHSAADYHKKRIMDVVDQLNEEELEKVSEMLKESEALIKQEQMETSSQPD